MAQLVTLGETMAAFAPDRMGPLRYVSNYGIRIAGAESNTAIGAAKLGVQAAWVSRLGADEFGQYIRNQIRAEGVDCTGVTFDPAHRTGVMFKQTGSGETSVFYVSRSEKFMRGVEIMEQMMPGTKEKILSGQFKVRDADMHRLARADFPNRKQIVHEILHPEDRPAPQSSYSHYSGINYSALEVAVRRIQQDFDFLMRYLPKLPDDSYAKTETLKILKQHKAYMAQFEEMLNDEEIA